MVPSRLRDIGSLSAGNPIVLRLRFSDKLGDVSELLHVLFVVFLFEELQPLFVFFNAGISFHLFL